MPTNEYAIRVRNVSKTFRVHLERNNTLKEKFLYAGRAKYRDFVALTDVSLDIVRGTTVGLLGVNGSGKSTLLKLVSRILYPDRGSIEVNGRVSSLLELGAGFHPEFTGRENIFLNGALLGLTKREIETRIGDIIDFSELGDFINEPIRSYSSGMYMRLAFSVAVAVDPEILLIDEILAVGDAAFQAKCMSRLKELQRGGRTIVIVTHDTSAIERFCDTALWLHDSRVRMEGDPVNCVRAYLTTAFHEAHESVSGMSFDRSEEDLALSNGPSIADHSQSPPEEMDQQRGTLGVTGVSVCSASGAKVIEVGESAVIEFTTQITDGCTQQIEALFGVSITDENDNLIFRTDMAKDRIQPMRLTLTENKVIRLKLSHVPLAGGTYRIDIQAQTEFGEPLLQCRGCAQLVIISSEQKAGVIIMQREWQFSGSETFAQ